MRPLHATWPYLAIFASETSFRLPGSLLSWHCARIASHNRLHIGPLTLLSSIMSLALLGAGTTAFSAPASVCVHPTVRAAAPHMMAGMTRKERKAAAKAGNGDAMSERS